MSPIHFSIQYCIYTVYTCICFYMSTPNYTCMTRLFHRTSLSKSCETIWIFHRLIQKSNNTTDVTFLKWPAGAYWWANEQRMAIVPTEWPLVRIGQHTKDQKKSHPLKRPLMEKESLIIRMMIFGKSIPGSIWTLLCWCNPWKNGGFEDSFRYPASF